MARAFCGSEPLSDPTTGCAVDYAACSAFRSGRLVLILLAVDARWQAANGLNAEGAGFWMVILFPKPALISGLVSQACRHTHSDFRVPCSRSLKMLLGKPFIPFFRMHQPMRLMERQILATADSALGKHTA